MNVDDKFTPGDVLGANLKLPPWLEADCEMIEDHLSALDAGTMEAN